jgi:gliding motility-associated-like protein
MKANNLKILLTFFLLTQVKPELMEQASAHVCTGQENINYQVSGDSGSIFHWAVEGAQIISDPYANTITVNWGYDPGVYSIAVYEEKKSGCRGNTKKMIVNLQASPIVNIDKVENICEGDQIELMATSGKTEYSYLWQDGSTDSVLLARTRGVYWVEVTGQNGCSIRDTVILVVNPLPKIELGNDTILCPPNELILDAGDFDGFVEWSTGENDQKLTVNEETGKIWVKVTDSNGCVASDTLQVMKCSEANKLIIPKAFTPDNGTTMNLWEIGGVEMYPNITIKIYDRWGILIFESDKGYTAPWDGKSNGKTMPMGAYYYLINTNDGSNEIKGSVTIVR